MKFSKSICTKKIIFILNFTLALVLFGCEKEYSRLSIQEELLADVEKFELKTNEFLQIAEKETDQKKLRDAFKSTRLSYKKIEWAVEYFTPDPARFINGPALDELEVAENKFLPPNGFQVIEELLYPNYEPKNKVDLVREIKMIKANLNQVRQSLSAITISDDFVIDAAKMQINRILALGITGFDSPIALQSIPETKTSLNALGILIDKMDYKGAKSKQIEQKIKDLCLQAEEYCHSNSDFNTFDRAYFIKNFLNPIHKNLISFQKTNAIKNIDKNNVVNPNAASIFDKDAFDVNAFIPSKEYQYTDQKAALGKQLFNENSFSKDKTRSCSSCHKPDLAFTDNLKTNKSLQGGRLSRNTPTLTYASLQNAQFWDMRQLDLEKQSTDVIQNKEEMHGNISEITEHLNKDKNYLKSFQAAFPKSNKIEQWQIQNALASYIRSLNAFDSKFDKYIRGESTDLTSEEKLGFNLFSGKAKCATCHFIPLFNGTVPPKFNTSEHEIIGTPAEKNSLKISPDLGRYTQHQMPQLKNAFKTPTVRNAAITAPYMHNGVFSTLEEVIDFYNKGGGQGSGTIVDNQSLSSEKLNLTEKEKKALIAFMETLTDEKYQH
ncbi:cytochrome c peroxidase [Flavobacterium granuli]|uniref:Cytochrome c peroxidase n=1 Tax=Flavobacterium granuli TaxID=280093 RepID=A0A1M5KGX6_9FLAO|nr:cytochrome c peroxidase [Flavobacterium granuli]PRZ26296.1 cytochrome c peroxidase [Flavobacterium granuli]SHG52194.1 cytochrome c peroxidase [Flavobacterium granuli]